MTDKEKTKILNQQFNDRQKELSIYVTETHFKEYIQDKLFLGWKLTKKELTEVNNGWLLHGYIVNQNGNYIKDYSNYSQLKIKL